LEIKVNNVTESGIGMTIPAYRNDVTREADVIEEVLRVYGYNNINFTEKLNASIATTQKVEDHKIQNKTANQLIALGFHEMLGNSLTSPKYISLSEDLKDAFNVTMLNPLSQDLSVLRQSMLFGGLEALAYNNNRKIQHVKLFEFGKTYHANNGGYTENKHLAITVSGNKEKDSWTSNSAKSDFFYTKGIITAVLGRLGISGYTESVLKNDLFSEGILFEKNQKSLVEFGVIKKKTTKHFGIEGETIHADFNWDAVLAEIPSVPFEMASIPKFPFVTRDFALLLDNSVTFESLKEAAISTDRKLLKEVTLFDVYTGKNLPKGKKSYALSFTIQDEKKTLTDKQTDKIMKKLQERFENDFGAILR